MTNNRTNTSNNGGGNANGAGPGFDPMGLFNSMMNDGSQFGIDIGITGPDGNKKNINVPIPDVAKMFQGMNLPGMPNNQNWSNTNSRQHQPPHPFQHHMHQPPHGHHNHNMPPTPPPFVFQHSYGPFHAGFSTDSNNYSPTSDNKSPENVDPSKKKKHEMSKEERHSWKKMHKHDKKMSKHEHKGKKKGRNIDNLARFIKHETYPDETEVEIGSKFIKVWTLRNDGLMTWPKVCDLLQIGGEDLFPKNFSFTSLSAHLNNLNLNSDEVKLLNEVRPGDEVQIEIELTAPNKPGFYETYFRLKAVDPSSEANGFRFGQRLWCKINVIEPVIQSLSQTSDVSTDSSLSDSSDSSFSTDVDNAPKNGEKCANGHTNSKENLQKIAKKEERFCKKEKKLQMKANKLRKKLAKIEKKLIKVQHHRVKKQEKKLKSKENKIKSKENKEKLDGNNIDTAKDVETFEVILMDEEDANQK